MPCQGVKEENGPGRQENHERKFVIFTILRSSLKGVNGNDSCDWQKKERFFLFFEKNIFP
jgi:hypothetical protein